MKNNNLIFIGARGAGKSRISRKLGKLTGRTVLPTDTLISYEANGESIPSIVKKEGWKGFREREYLILKNISGMKNILIDCGGGILVEAPEENDPENKEILSKRKIKLLKSMGTMIYIKRDVEWLIKKVADDPSRPDLAGDYRSFIKRRLPWYEKTSDVTIDMDKMQVENAIDYLMRKFKLQG